MTEIPQRIQQILSHYNLNSGEFAHKINVQKSSISHLLSGRNKPSFIFISKLLKSLPELNIEWFVTGEGRMLKNEKEGVETAVETVESSVIPTKDKPMDETVQTEKDMIDAVRVSTTNEKQATKLSSLIMVFDDNTFQILKNVTK